MKQIESLEQLRDLLGEPHALTQQKITSALTPEARDFIQKSALLFMATAGEGGATVSPKGDQPGFVKILDDNTLLVPERPGNKLLHGLGNILRSESIGLLFVIPGTEETLRVNGRAALYEDKALCREMAANGKAALLVIKVQIDECFFHCAKAFKRSKAWQAEHWLAPQKVNFGKQIARNAVSGKIRRAAVEKAVDAAVSVDYKINL